MICKLLQTKKLLTKKNRALVYRQRTTNIATIHFLLLTNPYDPSWIRF